jgi:hypothetical protein
LTTFNATSPSCPYGPYLTDYILPSYRPLPVDIPTPTRPSVSYLVIYIPPRSRPSLPYLIFDIPHHPRPSVSFLVVDIPPPYRTSVSYQVFDIPPSYVLRSLTLWLLSSIPLFPLSLTW